MIRTFQYGEVPNETLFIRSPLFQDVSAVVEEIIDFCLNNGFSVLGLSFSPIKGPQGNIEYLLYIKRSDTPQNNLSVTAEEVVEQSHETLDK